VIHHIAYRPHSEAIADRLSEVDQKDRHALGFSLDLVERRRAREQDHVFRVLDARNPDLLPVHDIAIVFLNGNGFYFRGIGAGTGLGHTHRLQAQFSAGNLWQILTLLCVRAVAQQRVHVVHLSMARARISPGAVDFFHDNGRLGEAQSGAAVFFGNQRGEPACIGERGHECFRITARFIDLLPVRAIVLIA